MNVEHVTIPIYVGSLFLINIAYIAVFLGILVTIPEYIKSLNIFIQVFLCLILMVRFHPFRENIKLYTGDSMFIFGAGLFLFINVGLVELSKIINVKKIVSQIPLFGEIISLRLNLK